MERYSDFFISKKQSQRIAFAIIAGIEDFCEKNKEDFELFLKSEEENERSETQHEH